MDDDDDELDADGEIRRALAEAERAKDREMIKLCRIALREISSGLLDELRARTEVWNRLDRARRASAT